MRRLPRDLLEVPASYSAERSRVLRRRESLKIRRIDVEQHTVQLVHPGLSIGFGVRVKLGCRLEPLPGLCRRAPANQCLCIHVPQPSSSDPRRSGGAEICDRRFEEPQCLRLLAEISSSTSLNQDHFYPLRRIEPKPLGLFG